MGLRDIQSDRRDLVHVRSPSYSTADHAAGWEGEPSTSSQAEFPSLLFDVYCHAQSEAQVLIPIDQAEELFGIADPEQTRGFPRS
jgi:hypothetical protein